MNKVKCIIMKKSNINIEKDNIIKEKKNINKNPNNNMNKPSIINIMKINFFKKASNSNTKREGSNINNISKDSNIRRGRNNISMAKNRKMKNCSFNINKFIMMMFNINIYQKKKINQAQHKKIK